MGRNKLIQTILDCQGPDKQPRAFGQVFCLAERGQKTPMLRGGEAVAYRLHIFEKKTVLEVFKLTCIDLQKLI